MCTTLLPNISSSGLQKWMVLPSGTKLMSPQSFAFLSLCPKQGQEWRKHALRNILKIKDSLLNSCRLSNAMHLSILITLKKFHKYIYSKRVLLLTNAMVGLSRSCRTQESSVTGTSAFLKDRTRSSPVPVLCQRGWQG